MFSRTISIDEVKQVVGAGEIINSYPDDKPYPSYLIAGMSGVRPIHIVVGENKKEEVCIVITAYEPDLKIWNENFKTKKK